ncbi:PREDICTED: RNA exonuclease 4 isoform X1 [Hipposideros armiger]|uniref:RNA exonuclease 4 n=1 Tax=Hipposideros armiger TaxID=186990 RepID=A0A8B7R1A2_HIPAR|nr:PREDICTED: RNA exonuclease 4 isoform X1 [Hipposideros armiger]
MVKALTPKRAPGDPVPEPGLVKKPPQKKKRKKRFWKNKAREVNEKPGSNPTVVAVRPPKAPEDFSQNWKTLQELLKQKSQAPEKPVVISQMDLKKQAKINQQNRKAKREAMGTEKTDQEATGGPVPGPLRSRKVPAPPTEASGAEHNENGSKKRTNGDISPKRGDIKHKKRKAKVTTALAPAPPTEEDIWFDDVNPEDIEAAIGPEAATIARRQLGHSECDVTLVKEQAFRGLTKALGMDCEMVGVGPTGEESIVARVSIVNQFGKCVYDKYVKPTQQVTDYRTAVSGIRPENLKQGEEFEVVQKEVAEMLKGRILVGHALHNDLKVLFLDHPKKKIRDTQKYKPFKSQVKSGRPSLKLLAERILGIRLQQAEHCSIQDAQAAMRLYVTVKKAWEHMAQDRRPAATAPDTGRSPAAGAAAPAAL